MNYAAKHSSLMAQTKRGAKYIKEKSLTRISSLVIRTLGLLAGSGTRAMVRTCLPPAKKQMLKSFYHRTQKRIIDFACSYSYPELLQALGELGISSGDVLMVHSAYSPFNGFQDKPQDIIKAFKEIIGQEEGTLLMLSLPYGGATYDYLKETEVFDVNRTVSHMGLITEIFRRQKDVVRSLHPTHPVCAFGGLANWFVQGHENCLYGCGPGSPFEKLAQKNAKALFFDVPVRLFTFFHYLEHLVQDKLPFPLYEEEVFEVKVITPGGSELKVKAKGFTSEAIERRRSDIMWKKMWAAKKVKERRIGMTELRLVEVRDVLSCAEQMREKGEFFYDLG